MNPYQSPDQTEIFWGMIAKDRRIDKISKMRGEKKHDSEK